MQNITRHAMHYPMQRLLQAVGVFCIGCGLCHTWPAAGRAAEPQPASKATDPGVLFDRLDTAHAGVLSADKIPADKRGLFERLLRLAGKPADGELTRAEFVAQLKSITEPATDDVPPAKNAADAASGSATAKSAATPAGAEGRKTPNPSKAFDRLDKHHTGKLTLSDIPEQRQKFFKRLLREAGKPKNGSLNKEEFVKAFEALLAQRQGSQSSQASAAGKNKQPAGTGQFDVDTLVARLMKLSTRPDGKLTKSDLPARMQDRFDKIDANQDGLVDEAELREWLGKVKRQLMAMRALSGAANPPAARSEAPKGATTK